MSDIEKRLDLAYAEVQLQVKKNAALQARIDELEEKAKGDGYSISMLGEENDIIKARIDELEEQQAALYKALATLREERLDAVSKLSSVDPYVDWTAYHKNQEVSGAD